MDGRADQPGQERAEGDGEGVRELLRTLPVNLRQQQEGDEGEGSERRADGFHHEVELRFGEPYFHSLFIHLFPLTPPPGGRYGRKKDRRLMRTSTFDYFSKARGWMNCVVLIRSLCPASTHGCVPCTDS